MSNILKKYFNQLLFLLLIYFSLFDYNCTSIRLSENRKPVPLSSLNNGDIISIHFLDQTKIKCIYMGHDSSFVFVGIKEDNKVSDESIAIKEIQKIQLLEKRPNKIWTVIMFLAFLSLLIYASYLSGIGEIGA